MNACFPLAFRYSGTSWATSSNYSSYSSNSNSSSGLGVGRKTSYGGNLRDTSFEENEEYEYEENQRRKALNARDQTHSFDVCTNFGFGYTACNSRNLPQCIFL